jgi:hypothetical protein
MRAIGRALRGLAVVATPACVLAAALPDTAGASTIHACVRPASGATRIVSARARCRRGEKRMSWSTSGPQGPAGPPGAPGSPGAAGPEGKPGIGPAYSTSSRELVELTKGKTTLLLAEALPPGSYVVSFKTNLGANSKTPGYAQALCGLYYNPGLSVATEGTSIDGSIWNEALTEVGAGEWSVGTTVQMQGAFSTKVTVTVAAGCLAPSSGAVAGLSIFSQLQAIGVSSIG